MLKFFLIFLLTYVGMSAVADVGLENRQGNLIKTSEMQFTDESGQSILLDKYFHKGRPVLLALAYYRCPGICTVVLNNMIEALKNLKIEPGRAFDVVIASIDSQETSDLAKQKKDNYLKLYGRT